ncbi:MAG TPA: hypothetical protein VK698_39385 [Kofleriaceae bacterium]|nr:hypothetical protein [Kofleriaceae bacterium]
MKLTTHRLSRKHQPVVDRVTLILDEAARVVKRHSGCGVGRTEVAVTTRRGVTDLACRAHEGLFGVSDPDDWDNSAGTTTLTRTGTLVIVNADAHLRHLEEVDRTLLHELAHAAQFNRPGARKQNLRAIEYGLGLRELSATECRAGTRRMDADELEAERAEDLLRQLAKAVR